MHERRGEGALKHFRIQGSTLTSQGCFQFSEARTCFANNVSVQLVFPKPPKASTIWRTSPPPLLVDKRVQYIHLGICLFEVPNFLWVLKGNQKDQYFCGGASNLQKDSFRRRPSRDAPNAQGWSGTSWRGPRPASSARRRSCAPSGPGPAWGHGTAAWPSGVTSKMSKALRPYKCMDVAGRNQWDLILGFSVHHPCLS